MERYFTAVLIILTMLTWMFLNPEPAETQTNGTPDLARSAEKQDYQAFDLGELYVKGDKIPGVYSITEVTETTPEQFETTHSQTVAEALTYIPGLLVTSGFRNEPTVRIHGFVQNKTLVLIDGVPYYDTARGALDLNSIPLDNVARIEVQKGVSSVLFGPNGLAGVINIITKKPTGRPSVDARAELGDYESRRFSLSHGMKVAKVSYWLGYEHLESRGWYLSRDFDPHTTRIRYAGVSHPQLPSSRAVIEDGGVRENSDSKTDALWAKIGIEPNEDSDYYVNFHYISRERGGPASLLDDANRVMTSFSQLFRWPRYDNWGVDVSGQQKVGDRVTFKGKLFYDDHFDNMDSYVYPNYTGKYVTGTYKDNILGGSLLSDIKAAETDILRLAYNFRRDVHKERDFAGDYFREAVSYTGSLAIENEFSPIKNLSLVAGLGYDWFNVTKSLYAREKPYDDHLSPLAGVTYTFDDGTRLFGSWARKIRYPTLNRLYSSSNGNPNLKLEKRDDYVIGTSRNLTRYARGELSFSYHNTKDPIC
jgi:iron complex outermembrane recepter protein